MPSGRRASPRALVPSGGLFYPRASSSHALTITPLWYRNNCELRYPAKSTAGTSGKYKELKAFLEGAAISDYASMICRKTLLNKCSRKFTFRNCTQTQNTTQSRSTKSHAGTCSQYSQGIRQIPNGLQIPLLALLNSESESTPVQHHYHSSGRLAFRSQPSVQEYCQITRWRSRNSQNKILLCYYQVGLSQTMYHPRSASQFDNCATPLHFTFYMACICSSQYRDLMISAGRNGI